MSLAPLQLGATHYNSFTIITIIQSLLLHFVAENNKTYVSVAGIMANRKHFVKLVTGVLLGSSLSSVRPLLCFVYWIFANEWC